MAVPEGYELFKDDDRIIIEAMDEWNNRIDLTLEEAEEFYNRLDFILHDETRAEIECQLRDLQYRESKLRESVAFGDRRSSKTK